VKRLGLCVAALLACNAWAGERCTALDGSSLRCRDNERVRIEGIKAPQPGEPGAEAAKQRLQKRIQRGELVIQRKGQDKYGYTLGRIFVDGHRITQSDVAPPKRK
jgi:endonuclease YncB( thermonuclease family)